MAKLCKEDLAILLIDFEKAYNRVNWGFLEGSLGHFGFEDQWIRGVLAMYRSASSQVLLARAAAQLCSFSFGEAGLPTSPLSLLIFCGGYEHLPHC